MNKQKQEFLGWRDGLPTAPDVEAICRQCPDLKIGDRVPYAEIESLLKIEAGGSRWKSVTDAWRSRMRERSIVIECEAGEAFYVATADQISSATYSVLKGVGGKVRRHRQKIAVARPTNDLQRGVLDHQARLMYGLERDARKARLNLLPSTAVAEPPQLGPPQRATK